MGKLIVGIICIGLGLLFIVAAWGGHFQSKKVMDEGGRAAADITDKKISQSVSGTGRQRTTTTDYDVYYVFETENGETVQGRYSIRKDTWDHLDIGDSIEIAYDFEDPNYNFPVGEGSLVSVGMPIVLSFFGLIPLFIGGLFLIGFFKGLRGP